MSFEHYNWKYIKEYTINAFLESDRDFTSFRFITSSAGGNQVTRDLGLSVEQLSTYHKGGGVTRHVSDTSIRYERDYPEYKSMRIEIVSPNTHAGQVYYVNLRSIEDDDNPKMEKVFDKAVFKPHITQPRIKAKVSISKSILESSNPPTISGKNTDLGNVSDEINYKYTVFDEDNDTLSIVERLNNEVIEVRNNIKSGSEFTATIPKEKIYNLELGKKNTLQIEVSDGKERIYRNITFTRINTAPIIKVISVKELGEIIKPFESKVSISDPEEDKVNLIYTINRIVLDENESYTRIPVHTITKEDIELDSELKYTIDREVWDKLLIGDYELEIKAIDDQSGENKEVITFTRTEDEIEFITPAIVKDVQPKQFISLWLINGNPTNIKIEACNNGLDDKPTWEDVTAEATEATPYNFKNSTKTADKWAVMAKVSLDGKGGSK